MGLTQSKKIINKESKGQASKEKMIRDPNIRVPVSDENTVIFYKEGENRWGYEDKKEPVKYKSKFKLYRHVLLL